MSLISVIKTMGNIALESLIHPMKTQVIERESGSVVARYETRRECIGGENNYPDNLYIVLGGFRR